MFASLGAKANNYNAVPNPISAGCGHVTIGSALRTSIMAVAVAVLKLCVFAGVNVTERV